MSTESTADCRRILQDISAYLDSELETTACDAIEQHCRQCRDCGAIVEGLRKTIGLCRQAASVPVPEPVRQRARDSVRQLLDSGQLPDGARGR